MMAYGEILERFRQEIGAEIHSLVEDDEVVAWFNDGKNRTNIYRPMSVTLTWTLGQSAVVLPADFNHVERIVLTSGYLGGYETWGSSIVFLGGYGARSAGSAQVLYHATYPDVTDVTDSMLTQRGDDACMSYALHRFYRKLAGSRADYRRYATMTNSNGVSLADLSDLSDLHYQDFITKRDELTNDSPSSYFVN